ncbi:hypothetical protein A9239_09920 [Methanosarcina sp. A14]|nr:hypothetical protein A9239_09920 [Methanosarcina sp. A14]
MKSAIFFILCTVTIITNSIFAFFPSQKKFPESSVLLQMTTNIKMEYFYEKVELIKLKMKK